MSPSRPAASGGALHCPGARRFLRPLSRTALLGLAALGCALWASAGAAAGTLAAADAVKRGEYLFHAAGGCGCHTDYEKKGPALAGGRPIKTPFGTFYSPNITPDVQTGIGRWTEREFVRAMRDGVAPDGSDYFPVFPYPAFTHMSDADLRDLWAYLRAQPAVVRPNRPHRVHAPFGWRFLIPLWRWLYFRPGRFQPDPAHDAQWNRGAYLVNGPAHCGECHTPRNWLGGPRHGLFLAGAKDGPEGELAPNITPDAATGIGSWEVPDIVWLLKMGLTPDGDSVQGLMAESIDHGFKYLNDADLQAIAVYLKGIPAVHHKVSKK